MLIELTDREADLIRRLLDREWATLDWSRGSYKTNSEPAMMTLRHQQEIETLQERLR